MSVRVVIADDQQLVRAGFRMILEAERDLEVVGEASDGRQALAVVREQQPDVVLMDIRMPEYDGIQATQWIAVQGGATRVLILTTFDLDQYVYDALCAGASGFLLKDVPADQLVAGVRMIAAGDALLAPSITRRLIAEFTSVAPVIPPGVDDLTPRELEVLQLIATGRSNQEIAATLVISETTVKTHVARVLMKIGVRNRVQAVVLAYEAGIVRPGRRPAQS